MALTKGNFKVGNGGHCVVTDCEQEADFARRDSHDSIKYYGGVLVCESCHEDDAKLFAAAKELLEACQAAIRKQGTWAETSKQLSEAIKKATE